MEIQGYKGFDKDLKCRGKQYAENEIFEEPNAEMCECGIHFCENPFDVLDYYPIINDDLTFNEYADVTALGDTKSEEYDPGRFKSVTTKLKIGAKIGLKGLINAFIDVMLSVEKTTDKKIGSSGDGAKIGSSGDECVICCAGHRCSISAKKGSWITLAEWKQDDHGNWHPKCVKTRKVDGKKIKEGVPYMLIDGKFVEQE